MRIVNGVDKVETTLKLFAGVNTSFTKTPFALSSAFPFLHYGGAKVRLYPKPRIQELRSKQVEPLAEWEKKQRSALGPFQRATVAVIEKAKQVKGATYVSENLFEQIVRGETDTHRLCEQLVERGSADDDVVRWGKALITHAERKRVKAEELNDFESEGDTQRNQIERVALATVEGRLFFTHETFLHREWAGLWFALYTNDLNAFKPVLRYLADTGIGGDRSVGKGAFDIRLDEIHELDIPHADEPNCFITLSRYLPADGECDFTKDPSSYTLSTIRPKHEAKLAGVGHHTYKRLLRVFEPGSFFPLVKRKEVYGQIINVGSNADLEGFEAYHSGLALPVFAKMEGTK
jgi:CRISPR-associated protein Csm4